MFKNMKLGAKIAAGFTVLLILLGILAYGNYSGLTNVIDRANKTDDAGQVINYALQIRRAEKNFMLRYDKKYIKQAKELLAELAETVGTARARFEDPRILKSFDTAAACVKPYTEELEAYGEAYDKKMKSAENMVEIGRNVQSVAEDIKSRRKNMLEESIAENASESELKDMADKVIAANRLGMIGINIRGQEKNYMIRHEEKYVEAVHSEIDKGLKLLNYYFPLVKDSRTLALMNKNVGYINEYRKVFDDYVSFTRRQAAAEQEFIKIARYFIDDFAAKLHAEQKELMHVQETDTKRFTVIASSVAILLGVLLAFILTKAITGPVLRIAETVRKVAKERDLTLEVPVSGKDEIGNMALEFNSLLHLLRDTFKVVDKSAVNVESRADDISKRAAANRERAEKEEKKMKLMNETVQEMGVAAGEVAQSSIAQKEAAEQSNKNIEALVEDMGLVAQAEQPDQRGKPGK